MQTLLHSQTKKQIDALSKVSQGSFVFYGWQGMGKRTTTKHLSDHLEIPSTDRIYIEPEKTKIGIAQIQNLQRDLSLTMYQSVRSRLVVIDATSGITTEAQNALLKSLEEPPARTIVILVTEQIEDLLSTIRSRCAGIYFAPLPEQQIRDYLVGNQGIASPLATELAGLVNGAPGLAIRLSRDETLLESKREAVLLAKALHGMSRFDRLLAANRLTGMDWQTFALANLRFIRAKTREATGEAELNLLGQQLAATERLYNYINANVAPRGALESFVLEL